MRVRANVLKTPQGIKPESVQKACEVAHAFANQLDKTGSVERAARKTAAATGTEVEVKEKKK